MCVCVCVCVLHNDHFTLCHAEKKRSDEDLKELDAKNKIDKDMVRRAHSSLPPGGQFLLHALITFLVLLPIIPSWTFHQLHPRKRRLAFAIGDSLDESSTSEDSDDSVQVSR